VNDSDVIAALATPVGKSALAIIRVSGIDSHSVIQRSIKEADKFKSASSNKIQRYNFINEAYQSLIDDITAIKYYAPKSYTGENMVEIVSHGSKIVINEILNEIIRNGGRIAGKGEFTRRAFLNNKMDLIKAEYILQKINSTNGIQQRICANIVEKKQEKTINSWREEIKKLLVEVETEIEFNEDVKYDSSDFLIAERLRAVIEKELNIWNKIKRYNKDLKMVICGPANVGKSSLFNTLLGYNRAIVTDTPGTTRDTISESIIIDNNEIEIIDSAGLRETENSIEKEGIERTKKEIEEASIVLWVNSVDQDRVVPQNDIHDKVITILNKIDLKKEDDTIENDQICISLEENTNIEKIVEKIREKIKNINDTEIPSLIANERHVQIAERIKDYLSEVITYWNEKEKAAYYMYKILEEIEELIGKRDREEVYNEIFSKFCIGK
jgi:tRNA modification GTPase